MKGESRGGPRSRRKLAAEQAENAAVAAFGAIAGDPERLARFLAVTGLAPATIRQAAAEPGFLPSVLAYLMADEALLVAVAGEIGMKPERLMQAHEQLSPPDDWSP